MATTRVEKDTFGPIEVPADHYWGAQTERSKKNFKISGEKQPKEIINALAIVKRASAIINHRLGLLPEKKAKAIVQTTDEILDNQFPDEFPYSRALVGSVRCV